MTDGRIFFVMLIAFVTPGVLCALYFALGGTP